MSESEDKLYVTHASVEQSREGLGFQSGRISGSTTAEKSREGPGNQPGGISRLSAPVCKGSKRKLNTKSYTEKYIAILEVEKGKKSKKQITEDYGIPSNTLSTWLKNKESIKAKYVSGDIEPDRKKARLAKFPEVESALLKWFNNARSQNVSVDGPMLQTKAREFADKLGIPNTDFDCSSGWVERFKLRNGLVFKKISGESNSVDRTDDEFESWKIRLKAILAKYSPVDVFNADKTAIFYRALPDKTLEYKSKACHGGKASKECLTIMVCANMSGTEKLPLLVLGKSEKPRCFKNVKTLPTEYKANKKAWMTSFFFKSWVREFDVKMNRQGRKIALVVDNCPAHPKDITNLKCTELVFLPRNTTSVTQPMDQGVIKNLKVHYRKQVVARKIKAIANKKEFSINVLDAMRMIRKAWSHVTSTTIKNCYRHAGFTSEQTTDVVSDDEVDDDIPLAHLARILGTSVSIDDYVNIDTELQATEPMSDCDILSDLIEARCIYIACDGFFK